MLITDEMNDFYKKADVVSCFIGFNDKHLLLQRQLGRTSASQWGPPAGKVEEGEGLEQAIVREVKEESGITLSKTDLSYFGSVNVRHGNFDFVYHIFSAQLTDQPEIILSAREHQNYTWATPEQALEMNMVEDQDWCVRWFYHR